MEVKLCKETAKEQIKQMSVAWGMYDAKAIISGGTESSLPEEMRDLLLANVMTGDVEIQDNGKKIVQHLHSDIDGLDKLVFARKLRRADLRNIQDLPEADQSLAIAEICTDAPKHKLADLTSRDSTVLTVITGYISFS